MIMRLYGQSNDSCCAGGYHRCAGRRVVGGQDGGGRGCSGPGFLEPGGGHCGGGQLVVEVMVVVYSRD